MADYIPRSDAQFDPWFNNLVSVMVEKPDSFQLSEDEVTELKKFHDKWNENYTKAIAVRDEARAAIETKDETRTSTVALVRSVVRRVQADDRISNANRRDAGLPVHKDHRTPIGPPTTAPTGRVEAVERLEHLIYFTDGLRRAKPKGVMGCRIYNYVGDTIPTDPKEFKFLDVASRSPLQVTYSAEEAGKAAHYLLRWVTATGEVGPWSSIVSATIPAI